MRTLTYNRNWLLLGFAGLLLLAITSTIALGVDPAMAAIASLVVVVAGIIVCKYPPILLAGLLYVGNFKTQAAVGVSLSDPTFIVFVMLVAAIGLDLLFSFAGVRTTTLGQRFSGQGRGVLLFVLFLALLGISFLYTPAPVSGWQKLSRFAAFETIAFFAPLVLFKDAKDFRIFLWAYFTLSIPIALRLIAGVAHPTDQQLLGKDDVTHIGEAALIGTTLFVLLFYRFPSRYSRVFTAVAMPLLVIALIASEARGPILSFAIVLLICMTVIRLRSMVSRKAILIAMLIIAVTAGAALLWVKGLPVIAVRGLQKEAELKGLFSGSLDVGGTTELRLEFFKSASKAFLDKPLFGWGLNGWSMYYYGEDKIAYPHNVFLEVAAEQGIVGLALFTGLLASSVIALLKAGRSGHREFLCVIPIVLFCILLSAVTGDVESRELFFWIGAGFVVSRIAREPSRKAYSVTSKSALQDHFSNYGPVLR